MFGKPNDKPPPKPQKSVIPRGDAAHPERQVLPPTLSPEQYAPRHRRLAQAAADAAQHVIDLENTVEQLNKDRDELSIQLSVVERENHRLKDELARVATDRDLHRDRVAEIETQFEDVASLLVKVIEKRMTARKQRQLTPDESLEDGISRIIAQDQEAPRL
jgi:predicted RNase H-like nuclease (RuvC/YqgF family)